jgi:ribosomal protein S27AE
MVCDEALERCRQPPFPAKQRSGSRYNTVERVWVDGLTAMPLELIWVDGLTAMLLECPHEICRPGLSMAMQIDRYYCGKCHLTYLIKKDEK